MKVLYVKMNGMIWCILFAKQLKLRIGNKAAYDMISKLFGTLENGNFEDRYYYNRFGELLFFYGEINQQLTYYQDVISLYLKYLDRYKILEKSNSTEEIRSNITFIYNRLSVAYKHFPDCVRHQKHLHYINLSLYMSRTLKNRQFLAENCYDKEVIIIVISNIKREFLITGSPVAI